VLAALLPPKGRKVASSVGVQPEGSTLWLLIADDLGTGKPVGCQPDHAALEEQVTAIQPQLLLTGPAQTATSLFGALVQASLLIATRIIMQLTMNRLACPKAPNRLVAVTAQALSNPAVAASP
jgi:hypothetical protein